MIVHSIVGKDDGDNAKKGDNDDNDENDDHCENDYNDAKVA